MDPLTRYLATLPGHVGRPRDARIDFPLVGVRKINEGVEPQHFYGCRSLHPRTGERCSMNNSGHKGSHVGRGLWPNVWDDRDKLV